MSFNKPIWWARDAASILRQNGSNEHADAVITVCDKHAELEAELAEAREDRKRLTWVIEQSNAGNGWLDDGVWDSAPYIEDCDDVQIIIRASIDAARGRK